jgi:hypothetical protein
LTVQIFEDEEDDSLSWALAVLGWFLSGLSAFILALLNLDTIWWKRILGAVGISILAAIILGVVIAAIFAAKVMPAVIAVGWGMLIAVMVTVPVYLWANAGPGVSIGVGAAARVKQDCHGQVDKRTVVKICRSAGQASALTCICGTRGNEPPAVSDSAVSRYRSG